MGRTVEILGEVGSTEGGVDMIVLWLMRCVQDGVSFYITVRCRAHNLGKHDSDNVPFEFSPNQKGSSKP